jgi:hypothetical protein
MDGWMDGLLHASSGIIFCFMTALDQICDESVTYVSASLV